jgi:hypothetical protein
MRHDRCEDHVDAVAFADDWVKAWNAHDLEKVLSHFADDVVFTSPVAAQFLDGSDGVIRGKAALRTYWTEGLRRIPDLHFEVVGVYVGVNTLAINYRNQLGGLVNEILIFGGSLVTQWHGTYLGSVTGSRRGEHQSGVMPREAEALARSSGSTDPSPRREQPR